MGEKPRRSVVPRRVEGVSLDGLSVSAAEGFLLSQIDGKTSVADLELITGLDEPSLADTLQQLLLMGLIETGPVVRPGRGIARPAIVPDRLPTAPPGGEGIPWRKTPAGPPPRLETPPSAPSEPPTRPAKPESTAARLQPKPEAGPGGRETGVKPFDPAACRPSAGSEPAPIGPGVGPPVGQTGMAPCTVRR